MADTTTDDSLKSKPTGRGGVRAGSGRKKGKLEPQTIERAKVLKAFRDRVAKNADQLLEAQMTLATGVSMLFRVDKDSKGNSLPAIQVTDPEEIKRYIDDEAEGDEYYFITNKQPDNKAIDSLLDRTFGRPDSKVDLTSQGERLQALPVIISPVAPRDVTTQE